MLSSLGSLRYILTVLPFIHYWENFDLALEVYTLTLLENSKFYSWDSSKKSLFKSPKNREKEIDHGVSSRGDI